MQTEDKEQVMMELLKQKASLANVCTEPGMVALAAARASSLLGGSPEQVQVHLSSGVLKNALSAGLPHTDRKGPGMAAAAGAVSADPSGGLLILGDLGEDEVRQAAELVDAGRVEVKWAATQDGVYCKCVATKGPHKASVVISGSHTNISEESLDGQPICDPQGSAERGNSPSLAGWSFSEVVAATMAIPEEELGWLFSGALSCAKLAASQSSANESEATVSLMQEAGGEVRHAILARMNGTPWPVLTSGGSGNQGIMVSIPLLLYGRANGVSKGQITRALALAHAVNMWVKAYIGEVSALCGGMSAGAGLAAAMCWMQRGSRSRMARAATEVLASLSAMLCDGAKATCALKGTSAVTTAMEAASWAMSEDWDFAGQGIVGESIEDTLRRLGTLNSRVFAESDQVLLELLGIKKV